MKQIDWKKTAVVLLTAAMLYVVFPRAEHVYASELPADTAVDEASLYTEGSLPAQEQAEDGMSSLQMQPAPAKKALEIAPSPADPAPSAVDPAPSAVDPAPKSSAPNEAGGAGVSLKEGWNDCSDGGKIYCFADGSLATGLTPIDGFTYYFDENGYMQRYHQMINGQPYQFYSTGQGYLEGWIDYSDGKRGYSLGGGKLAVGAVDFGAWTYNFDRNGYLITTITHGIDVSEFQGEIDWAKVKQTGADFAIIRTGGRFGGSGKLFEDDYFHQNMRGALANGNDVGAYFYTQAITEEEAVEEAQYICGMLKEYNITFPVAFDTEYVAECRHNLLTRQERTNVAKAFCEEVKRQGYTPMIYSNLNWLNQQLDMSQLTDYQVWVAHYNDTCGYDGQYCCWQHTSTGHIDGINGCVDLDMWYHQVWTPAI